MLVNPLNPNQHRFSADVRMQLHVNGDILKIGQLGPDFLILDNPTDHPPGEAEITLTIDGREKRWAVQLLHGIQADQQRTRIARCPDRNGPPRT